MVDAEEGFLEPVIVTKEKGPSAKKMKKYRRRERRKFDVRGPPPETVKCGWNEYKDQGGATYEDVQHYRDYELGHLIEQQRSVNESGTDVLYC